MKNLLSFLRTTALAAVIHLFVAAPPLPAQAQGNPASQDCTSLLDELHGLFVRSNNVFDDAMDHASNVFNDDVNRTSNKFQRATAQLRKDEEGYQQKYDRLSAEHKSELDAAVARNAASLREIVRERTQRRNEEDRLSALYDECKKSSRRRDARSCCATKTSHRLSEIWLLPTTRWTNFAVPGSSQSQRSCGAGSPTYRRPQIKPAHANG